MKLQELCPGTIYREIVSAARPGQTSFNPSVAWSPERGYSTVIRSSNYLMNPDKTYQTIPEGIIRTTSFLATLNDELYVQEMNPIDEAAVEGEVLYPWVRDMEDSRLIWNTDKARWQKYGTVRYNRADGQCNMALDTLSEDGLRCETREFLPSPDDSIPQKNFMFVVPRTENTGWINMASPSIMYHNGKHLSNRSELPEFTTHFRGGSQAIQVDDGYLAVVHEVTWEPDRYYWHRFVLFDTDGFLKRWSEPFSFFEPGIEFAAGIVAWSDRFVVSFGQHDVRCFFAFVPKDEVFHLLDGRTVVEREGCGV